VSPRYPNISVALRQQSAARAGDRSDKTSSKNVRHNGRVTKALHHKTLIRCSDEPKLEIGDLASIREGVVGVVLARFNPSGERRNEVHYVVELRPETGKRAQ
jgi:hypothetical protein